MAWSSLPFVLTVESITLRINQLDPIIHGTVAASVLAVSVSQTLSLDNLLARAARRVTGGIAAAIALLALRFRVEIKDRKFYRAVES